MEGERKSRLIFYFQLVVGIVVYALFNSTSIIEKASEDLARSTSRKKALLIVLSALAVLAVLAAIAVALLGSARETSLSQKTGADQAALRQELSVYFLEHNVQGEPQFFPIDDQLRVEATLGELALTPTEAISPDTLVPATRISFTISGPSVSLPVYYTSPDYLMGSSPAPRHVLMVFFKDLTNGTETPEKGRYLLLPATPGPMNLDFNLSRLLPCFYFNEKPCPPLTSEHLINLSIRAGQKN
ncbi:MAG: DUF1684 domain-containing protein [Cyclobacteriaceae bacterium]|nr:DUF1684 domain-containing protein [Cyclobacteriaceae bacterium]